MEVYLPFWIKASSDYTYGFNLYVAKNTTVAILDAALPNDLLKLQASLNDLESMNITAKVNATVTERNDPSPSERYDYSGYWHEKQLLFNQSGTTPVTVFLGAYQDMWVGTSVFPNTSQVTINNTEIFVSNWNTTENQTFFSEAEQYITTRRICVGVWNIKRQNVSLVDVVCLQSADEIDATQKQDLITNWSNSIRSLFLPFLGEYDWKMRYTWDQPLPGTSYPNGPPQFSRVFSTRPAFIADMLWARLVSNEGPD